jgi:hypothetical protein
MRKTDLLRFDMLALCKALDEARLERSLSWVELAAEINRPFAYTTSIPINVATIRRIAKKQAVTSAVALQVLRWLDRTPESFLVGHEIKPQSGEALPEAGPDRILRFDTRRLYEALNAERRDRDLTWKQVAQELPGFTDGMLTNLAKGPLIGFPRVMFLTQWVRKPASSFVLARSR